MRCVEVNASSCLHRINQGELSTETFLGCVAKACLEHYKDLSEFCFVFPNRRSGTFFLKRLSEECGDATLIAPEVIPVGDFMSRLSGIEVAPRIIQLMQLYLCYRDLRNRREDINHPEELVDFDEFLHWGEVVLNDFNEVDLYDADAAEVFKNVTDYRTIATDYLTDSQKEVIQRYFGYSPDFGDVKGFWKSFTENDRTVLKDKFRQLWEMLYELYEELRRRLEHPDGDGFPLCMAGSGYRIAMENVEKMYSAPLGEGVAMLPWKHIVVVGLDSLSTTEGKTFTALQKLTDADGEPVIDFFWDIAGPVLDNNRYSPGNLIRHNKDKNFPEPSWSARYMSLCRNVNMPDITEIAVPSNAMQVKVAGSWVSDLIKQGYSVDNIENARVAVVIPDENLLLPLLYSLPLEKKETRNAIITDTADESGLNVDEKEEEKIEHPEICDKDNDDDSKGKHKEQKLHNVNLTMGWPMRFTSTSALMYHLQKIHSRRLKGSNPVFISSDIRLLISQPLVQTIIGIGKAVEINTKLNSHKRRTITWEELSKISEELGMLLSPVDPGTGLAGGAAWIEDMLLRIDEKLAESPASESEDGSGSSNPSVVKTKVERMQIQAYITALNQLVRAAADAGVEMRFNTLFHILQRMVNSGKINFEGEPLQGLQVMGFLETRALDFDKLVILSMNDKVMPRRARKRSFIPDMLRRGYGLPLANADELRYSYWFYRLLSRANDVTLVYDSRVGEGMRSGGKSRYLMQLEKMYARTSLKINRRIFELGSSVPIMKSAEKTRRVLKRMEGFFDPDTNNGLKLSATALQSYMQCPLQFYYRFVLGYSDDPVPSGFIDPITQGTIFHEMMLSLYFTTGEQRKFLRSGKVLDKDFFNYWLSGEADGELQGMISRVINAKFSKLPEKSLDSPLSQSSQMVADKLLEQVRGVLRYDLMHAPVKLYGGEVKYDARLKIGDVHPWIAGKDFTVNITGSLDRVDDSCGHPRVVDFKTGAVHIDMRPSTSSKARPDLPAISSPLDKLFTGDYSCRNMLQLLLYADMVQNMMSENGDVREIPVEMVIFDTNVMERGGKESHPYLDEKRRNLIMNQLDPAVADFKPRLLDMIREMFNPDIPFEPAKDPANCDKCVFSHICLSET